MPGAGKTEAADDKNVSSAAGTAAADQPVSREQGGAGVQMLRTHRLVIGTIAAGTVTIAGIGFAGSYTALRDLAIKKGFGTFAYLFPIGIDAGICVLLALDLALAFIRTPYPLLRPTAWLLTAATIAFNAATAWPDPLGVGMHAVIPLLFIVAVEAARHATGRIADITADTHIEGVRLARWLLSPARTFLLWRRMKLWEQRSYQQALQLEQERLIYQAHLHSRYGRTWRRTAPAQALTPLRLTRHGIPLTHTTPTGPTATGIQPMLLPPAPQPTAPRYSRAAAAAPAARRPEHLNPVPQQPGQTVHNGLHPPDGPADIPATRQDRHPPHPHPPQAGHDGDREPPFKTQQHAGPQQHPRLEQHEQQSAPGQSPPEETDGVPPFPASPGRTRQPGDGRLPKEAQEAEALPRQQQTREVSGARQPPAKQPTLTTADRYYLAWMTYQADHGREPSPGQLSAHLATLGYFGQNGQPLSASNLRRHYLRWRIYNIWTTHQTRQDTPSADDIAQECAARGITGQYNRPVTTAFITDHTTDFQRRRQALTHRHTSEKPPQPPPA